MAACSKSKRALLIVFGLLAGAACVGYFFRCHFETPESRGSLEYFGLSVAVSGGIGGGVHERIFIWTNSAPVNIGDYYLSPTKPRVYTIDRETARRILATMEEEDFFCWNSED